MTGAGKGTGRGGAGRNDPRVGARHPELTGRIAVVTGAAKGIGLGIATRLTAEGMKVVLFDNDAAALSHEEVSLAALAPGAVLAVLGDVGHEPDIDHLFEVTAERFGAVDVLVNNAADLQRRSTLDEHRQLLDKQLAVNVAGPYLCAQRAAAVMETTGKGTIINISSVGGARAHHDGLPYDVTKGAIDALTRAMAVDLGRFGIRVNAIAPGVTSTRRSRRPDPDESGRTMADLIPLRRAGSVEDIAAAAAFLASDESSYITGHVLFVDGGITAQLSPPGQHAF